MGFLPAEWGGLDVPVTADIFLFEEFRLNRRDGGLFRQDEHGAFVPVAIGARALDVLGVLVKRPGVLVLKDEIMEAVWPHTTVDNANLTIQISTLRRVLDQGRAEGSCIQTVAALGYRFVVPVIRVERAKSGGAFAPELVAPRLSIVVLPFANLSDDRQQQYFADGLSDDLTTDLSRLAGMFVIARNTAFTYKDKPIDAKQIGRELGVRYVLEGSVRRSGKQIRVNAQLIDAQTGAHLWAERFDRDTADLFALQDEITSRIANALDIELIGAEAARPIENPDALDYILRGRAASLKSPTPEKYAEAIDFFDCALALQPRSVEAKSLLAAALANRALDLMTDTAAADLARAESLLSQALLAAPHNPRVRYTQAELLRVLRRDEEAIPEYEMAIASNRNWADAFAGLGWCKFWTGSIDETIRLHERAIHLSPRDPNIGYWFFRIGRVHLLQSRTDEAIIWLEKARRVAPALPFVHFSLSPPPTASKARPSAPPPSSPKPIGEDGPDGFGCAAWVMYRPRRCHYRALPTCGPTVFWGPQKVRLLCEATFFVGLRKAGLPEE
jgi:TolB-like protein/Tfp pilus assembly protein PilF